MNRRFWVLSLLIAISCTTATAPQREPVHVVIVGTTDVHGWFNGHVAVPPRGGEGIRYGGSATFMSYLSALRAANPGHVLLVDSGDLFQGTMESNMFEGEPIIRAYNALGYTASAVGNHEFDYGPIGPNAVPRSPGDDPFGALERNAKLATFSLLSANMVEKATGRTPWWAKPSILVNVSGAKVGIIGLSTPDTPNVTMAANVTTLSFTDPVAAAIREAKSLRERGADAVIVIAHMGGRCNDMNDIHDVGSCSEQQEAMQFLEALPQGTIDAYFAGHTHSQMRQIINGVPAVQALAYSREFSSLDLYIDPAAHHVVKDRTNIRPNTMICPVVYAGTDQCDPAQMPAEAKFVPRVYEGKTITPDVSVARILDPYLAKVATKRNEKIGARSSARFTKASGQESSLGDLLTDTLRESAKSDVAYVNSGGIRMPLPEGELIYGDVFEVAPFDNYLSVVQMTGQEIIDSLQVTTTGDRGILQVAGIKYVIDAALPAGHRVTSVTLPDGTPIDTKAMYRVAMPDFLAAGGDGLMPVMSKLPKERFSSDFSRPLRDMWVEMFHKHAQPLVPKTDGRITVLNAPPRTNGGD
ncbi:MAG TPA: 5'-nucleotidase C-terminal domain-containing protein [Thermoanaerobaculia bacterium]|nr:5'-nucleotidase C-terminal domain-containing protein [Thermoanaerobaculia bacterium]